MKDPKVAPYGSWKSPISSDLIVSKTIRLMECLLVNKDIYWLEMRPGENGRYVVVRRGGDDRVCDINQPSFSARTRAHEYGGASYQVDGKTVFLSTSLIKGFIDKIPRASPDQLHPRASISMRML